MESLLEHLPALLLGAGGGGGLLALLRHLLDKRADARRDSWAEQGQVHDNLWVQLKAAREEIKERNKMIAAAEGKIIELNDHLDHTREERRAAEDQAAELRRQNLLLEEQVELMRMEAKDRADLLEHNREILAANRELVRHVHECERRCQDMDKEIAQIKKEVIR